MSFSFWGLSQAWFRAFIPGYVIEVFYVDMTKGLPLMLGHWIEGLKPCDEAKPHQFTFNIDDDNFSIESTTSKDSCTKRTD